MDKLNNVEIPYKSTEFSIEITTVESVNRVEQNVTVYYVDDSYVQLNDPEILLGVFSPSETCAVIDYNTAISLFATKECIGKNITIDDKNYTIVGVVKPTNIISMLKYCLQESTVYVGMNASDDNNGTSFCFLKSRPELLPIVYNTFCLHKNIDAYAVYKDAQSLIHSVIVGTLLYAFTFTFLIVRRKKKDKAIVIIFYVLIFMIICYCLCMLIFQPVAWQSTDIIYKYINCVIPITADVVTIQYVIKFLLYGYLIVYVASIFLTFSLTFTSYYRPSINY